MKKSKNNIIKERCFIMITIKDHYPVIDQTIQQVKDQFGSDSKIAVMFENCISNTLQTTIKVLDDGSIFVITGDIPAMWLRDSACQLRPFLFFCQRGSGDRRHHKRPDPEADAMYPDRSLRQRL